MNEENLKSYLNDHLAGSTAAVELAQHAQDSNPDTPLGAYLYTFLEEVEEDRGVVKDLLERLGGGTNPVKTAVGWFAEKAARLKLNHPLQSYTAFVRMEELEGLLLGVRGKLALWHALEYTVASDPHFDGFDFIGLAKRAEGQLSEIERHRLEAAREAFLPDAPPA
ncbi:MAG: hypothetical protein AVDCRST_MAG86-706 [uncultured Truepera sp.]|uniref:Uncharacterized protein n=1 Tax=uncultured Truepera sp. TaxID=543023 RepID=A0A6J4UU83_9DEIN|nr:MAG: hypothetical protein AVDCRST_MAG86-706 [uncultured Truepera sp.]